MYSECANTLRKSNKCVQAQFKLSSDFCGVCAHYHTVLYTHTPRHVCKHTSHKIHIDAIVQAHRPIKKNWTKSNILRI